MSDYGLKTTNDFNGPLADLIKITNAYSKNGEKVNAMINVLKRLDIDKEQVLKEINQFQGRTKTQEEIEAERKERASDFGIGE